MCINQKNDNKVDSKISRFSFISSVAGVLTASLLPTRALAIEWPRRRVLWLQRQGTSDNLRTSFCDDGKHVNLEGYRAFSWLLRDRHVSESVGYVPFSINTIEALWEIQQLYFPSKPIIITSGYRTRYTNSHTDGAAQNSQHLYATAVDMYVDDVSMDQLFVDCYSRAISGGIGYYTDHIHLDTGSRRYWMGDVRENHIPAEYFA